MVECRTYTPAIPDSLMRVCNGDLNMAGMAARIAGFIQSGEGVAVLSYATFETIYGWSTGRVRKYCKRFQELGLFEVKNGTNRGAQTEWRKGTNFAGYFGSERVQILSRKGTNFAPINKNININNLNKEINKERKYLNYSAFYERFGTTSVDEVYAHTGQRWEQRRNDKGTYYIKQS